jgi:hypothetical protein
LVVVGMGAVVAGCGGELPTAPDGRLLTISGYVYAQATASGEPVIGDVVITVQEVEGPPHTAISDGLGFYTVSVRAGTISITASKLGYATRASSFDMSNSTVLNFSLLPD